MEFLSLSRRRSSARNVPIGEERGETDVFAGYHQTTSQNFQFPFIFCKADLYIAVTLYIMVTLPFPKGDHCTPVQLYISVSLYSEVPKCIHTNVHYLFVIVEWYWKVWLCPWLLRITAVLLFLLSVTLVWSEVTFFNNEPVLSIFALMIDGASVGYYYFYVEVCQTNL